MHEEAAWVFLRTFNTRGSCCATSYHILDV